MQYKSSTDTKRWIPLDSFTWKGHNQISARHARGGDFAVVHTFETFLFIGEGGIRSRAIMGLATASTLMETIQPYSKQNCIQRNVAKRLTCESREPIFLFNRFFIVIKFLIIWMLFSFCDCIKVIDFYLSEIVKKSQFICIIYKILDHRIMS